MSVGDSNDRLSYFDWSKIKKRIKVKQYSPFNIEILKSELTYCNTINPCLAQKCQEFEQYNRIFHFPFLIQINQHSSFMKEHYLYMILITIYHDILYILGFLHSINVDIVLTKTIVPCYICTILCQKMINRCSEKQRKGKVRWEGSELPMFAIIWFRLTFAIGRKKSPMKHFQYINRMYEKAMC